MPMNPKLLRPRAVAQPAAPFAPTDIASLQIWLDAADPSTLFQNSDGTAAASSDEDPVGYWANKSGNGLHFTQSVNNDRPSLSTSTHAQNGKPTLFFDGTNDYLDSGVVFSAFESNKAITLFVVMRTQGANGAPLALKREDGDDYITGISFDQDLYGPETFGITLGRGSGSTAGDYADKTFAATEEWQLVTASVSASQNSVSAKLNKQSQSLSSGSGTLATEDFLSSGSGSHRAFIGARGWAPDNLATFFHSGAIAEIVVYGAALSAQDIEAVENYLWDKWGLA